MALHYLRRPGSRLSAAVAAVAVLALSATSAFGVTGEVYSGNISARTAALHLLGDAPRDPEVVSTYFNWNGTTMVMRVHVVRVDPWRSASWEVEQIAALTLNVNGRTRMTDTNSNRPGKIRGYSCGAGGADHIGVGTSRLSATNTYTFAIPRSAFIKCGLRSGQLVYIHGTSMMQTDNAPSSTGTVRFGAWAAQWISSYHFRL